MFLRFINRVLILFFILIVYNFIFFSKNKEVIERNTNVNFKDIYDHKLVILT